MNERKIHFDRRKISDVGVAGPRLAPGFPQIRRGRCLTILINDRCPLHCAHCSLGYSKENRGSSESWSEEKLYELIAGIDKGVYRMVAFSGGEPTASRSLLAAGIKAAHDAGFVTTIVSAPVWAKSAESAHALLKSLPQLTFLVLSCDEYHLQFLDEHMYERAIDAARDQGLLVSCNVTAKSVEAREAVLVRMEGFRDRLSAITFSELMPLGNATAEFTLYEDGPFVTGMESIQALRRTCSIGDVLVDVKGNAHACCWSASVKGSPLTEHCEAQPAAAALARVENSPALRQMLNKGFIDSLEEPAIAAIEQSMRGKAIVNECHLCMSLMQPTLRSTWDCCVPALALAIPSGQAR